MPHISRNDIALSFSDSGGEGPVVLLQHPLTASGEAFAQMKLVDTLQAQGYRCVCPDSVAHGASGTPTDPGRYALAERVADVLAIADHVGAETFHFAGYSMGGWIGTGILQAAPSRVLSLAIGGWDTIEGARHFTKDETRDARETGFRAIMAAMSGGPGMPQDAAEERVDGLVRCYLELFEPLPSLAVLSKPGIPIAFYCGSQDPYAANVRAAAKELAAHHREVDGDHLTSFYLPDFPDFIRASVTGAS